jgi:steroid 5-alpha reductase family enzyme
MTDSLGLTFAISLLIQAVFFAFAATFKTDKVTDLSYGLSFVIIAAVLLVRDDPSDWPQRVLAAMVILWGLRLAGYLLLRIVHMGRDKRFDGVRENFLRFLRFWVFQGLAVWVIMLPVIVWFGSPGPWNVGMTIGAAIWAAGFLIEAVADAQKFAAKSRPGGESRWMDTGLWRYSRHPNYFGELLVWWGVFVYVAADLSPAEWVSIVGPIAITFLLLRVTGIPTLEASASRKWGSNPDYLTYVARTSRLVPLPPRSPPAPAPRS